MSVLDRMRGSSIPVTPAVTAAVAAAPVVPLGQVPAVSAAVPAAPSPATQATVAALRAKALGGLLATPPAPAPAAPPVAPVAPPAAPPPAPVPPPAPMAADPLAQASAVGFKDDPRLPTVHDVGGAVVHSLECKDGLFVAFLPDGSASRRATSRAGAVECLRLGAMAGAPAPAALPPAPEPPKAKRGRPKKDAAGPQTVPAASESGAVVVPPGDDRPTLFIDIFPLTPDAGLRSVTTEIVEPARAAVEAEAGMDYRLIDYKGKQVLAAEVAERLAGMPLAGEWVVMSKHVDNEVMQELVRVFCSRGRAFRGTI